MNTEPSAADLRHAIVQVVEEGLLTFVDDPQAAVEWPDEVLSARIQIRHPYLGELFLAAPSQWCAQISASLQGLEKPTEESTGKHRDALGELLNMVCGIFVSEGGNLGPRAVFDLPQVELIARHSLHEQIAMAWCHLILEAESGHPLAIWFTRSTLESA
jgi:hypothetical protein